MTDNKATNKRIASNTIALYFRMLFTMAVGLFTSRVILDSLGVLDYGIYNLVGGFVAMFQIVRAGFLTSIQRFITYDLGKGDVNEVNKTFSTSVIIILILSVIMVIIAELVGIWFIENKLDIPDERIYAAHWVFQLSLISLVFTLISFPYNALIIAHERMKAFAYISIYEVIAKLGVAYVLFVSSFDKLILYASLLCLVQLSVRFIYSSYCLRNFTESRVSWKLDRTKMKGIFSFTGWEMIGSVAGIAFNQGITVLLGMFFSPVVNAARGVSVQVQSAIAGFVTNFQTAINPQITKSYSSREIDYLYRLIFTSARFSYFLMLVFSLPLLLVNEEVLDLWLVEVPEYTSIFLRIIIVVSMIDAVSNSIMTSVEATGNIKEYQITLGTILLLIVPISYIVLKFGAPPYSVFIVHLVIALIVFMLRLYLGYKIVGYNLYEYIKEVIKPIVMVTILSSIFPFVFYINLPKGIERLVIVSIISILSVGFTVYALGLKVGERKVVKNKIQSLVHR